MARVTASGMVRDTAGGGRRRKIDDWEAREALRTLRQADEIRGDKRLMAAAKREADRMSSAVKPTAPKRRAKATRRRG